MVLEGTSVLVVDDDEDTLEILSFLIGEQGGTVRSAVDAAQALEKLAMWTPDIVVLDISMPGMDGYGLLAAIRRIDRLADTPAIALTAHVFGEDRRRCLEAGFAAHVSKPCDTNKLLSVVASLVSGPSSSKAKALSRP
jgi:CheY-like chemotaxis protein